MDEPLREVTAALEMAADELDGLVRSLRDQGAEAYRTGDTASFERLQARCKAVEAFQKRFAQLQQEWTGLSKQRRTVRKRRETASQPRTIRGELLSERVYLLPILETLRDAGGSARVREVLERVHQRIGHQLTPRDRQTLRNGQIRWENRAQWMRMNLVRAGFVTPDSRKGVWEITDAGLRELQASDLDATWAKVLAAKQASRR